jgi:hypothetical protein
LRESHSASEFSPRPHGPELTLSGEACDVTLLRRSCRDVPTFGVGRLSACTGSGRTSDMAHGWRCSRSPCSWCFHSVISTGLWRRPHHRFSPPSSNCRRLITIQTSRATLAPSALLSLWRIRRCSQRFPCCCCRKPWNSFTCPRTQPSHIWARHHQRFSRAHLRSPDIDR